MRRLMADDETIELAKKINQKFGSDFNPANLRFFVKDEKRGDKKIFLYSGKEIPKIPAEWIGLHFGTIQNEEFIPSIEGAQIIGRTATMIMDIGKEEAIDIMSGFDIGPSEEKPAGRYILKSGRDIIGVGKLEGKKIINIIPRSRRISRQYQIFDR